VARTTAEQVAFGRNVFTQNCAACHQPDGRGLPGAFPPLAASDYLNADVNRAIAIVVGGKTGPITVNGQTYSSVMPALNLSDDDVANVLTYVYSQWGNKGTVVTREQVARIRASTRPADASAH
jgi:nitrite reductase (NO-forming)